MVSSRTWLLSSCFDARPSFAIQIEIEKVIEVCASFALIPAKEVKAVHEGNAAGPRPLVRLLSIGFDLVPAVLSHAVFEEVVQSLVVVRACEQVYVSVGENALVTSSRSENLALRVNLHPLVHLHLLEVLFRVLSTHMLRFFELAGKQLAKSIFLKATLLLLVKFHG